MKFESSRPKPNLNCSPPKEHFTVVKALNFLSKNLIKKRRISGKMPEEWIIIFYYLVDLLILQVK